MTTEQLKQFFEDRPSLSKAGLAREAGTSNTHINNILRGDYSLNEKTVNLLLPSMRKYGYKEPEV